VVPGGTAVFSVGVSGTTPLTYRWRKGTGSPFTNITLNQNIGFLAVPNASLSSTGTYAVIVTNYGGTAQSTSALLTLVADTDGNGLPDWYEALLSSGTNNPTQADFDSDGDGMTNLQEFLAGTDPQDPLSYLKVNISALTGNASIWFMAVTNRTYTVQYKDGMSAPWQNLGNVGARDMNRVETIVDARPGATNRFYRLVTPVMP
jgi:hypothetical protein